MVDSMKAGSAIIDLASENGGNCSLTKPDEIINHNGITIDGTSNIPSEMSIDATQVLSKNIVSFLTHVFKEEKLDLDDEKNDDLIPDMSLHNLYDMTEDVAESEKIKRAESKLIGRQSENS